MRGLSRRRPPCRAYPHNERLETGLPVQRAQLRIDAEEHHRVRPLAVRAIEKLEGSVARAEREMDLRDLVRWDVGSRGTVLQLPK